ncbi:SRPBCC domain-containing protein [Chitinophaga sp. CF418]|uniref:SRPBCC domain-containing protein n=1 Tax=Chitinophaga sp. CF418 TaxID=1855287 RepID=UPI0009244D4E|nr:SRPBCC domain-containing protein [Chitinophaga sp. CF418]SHN27419.1 hypothetical protein SAMN05216311_1083 [Chitinophaga sp. CF418]
MKNPDFTTAILVDQTAQQAFNAINNVRGWWSENIKGNTDELNSEFTYSYKDVHRCRIKIIELIPAQKAVWHVLDNYFSFTADKNEWKDTKIIFEIVQKGDRTEVHFMHQGLVPAYECYQICHDAWTGYIQESLKNLIATGKGAPNPKEMEAEESK